MGPDTYDLVSLLRDSYVDLPEQTVDELIAYFLALKGRPATERDVPAALRPDGAAAQPQGARHVRLPDHRAAQPGLHPVHPAHAPLRPRQPRRTCRASRACASSWRRTSRSSGRRVSRERLRLGAQEEFDGVKISRFRPESVRSVRLGSMVQSEVHSARNGQFHALRDFHAPLSRPAARAASTWRRSPAYGFEAIELFATRSHFDYHDERRSRGWREWLAETGLDAAQRPRADHRRRSAAGDQWAPTYSNAVGDARPARRRRCAKPRRRCGIARRIPFDVLVRPPRHAGEHEQRRTTTTGRRRCAASRRSAGSPSRSACGWRSK